MSKARKPDMAKTPVTPDVHILKGLMEEYVQMFHEAEPGIKKVLALKPETEAFWDALTDVEPAITLIGSRSNSIEEEINDLIDQLPDD